MTPIERRLAYDVLKRIHDEKYIEFQESNPKCHPYEVVGNCGNFVLAPIVAAMVALQNSITLEDVEKRDDA
jgi:hypothetical protein